MGRAVLDAAWARAAEVERSPVFRQKNPELDIRNPEPYDRCAAGVPEHASAAIAVQHCPFTL